MSYKLIVADDEYFIRKKLVKIIDYDRLHLELTGDFENGQEVLDYLALHHFDIILLDIRMPKVSGLEVARFLYENHPETRVIILSGFSDFEYAQTTLRYQVFDYLLKPVEAKTLNDTLEHCIRRIEIRRQEQNRLDSLSHYEKSTRLCAVLWGRETFQAFQSLYTEFEGIRYSAFYSFFVDMDCSLTAGGLISVLRAQEIECEYFIESDHIFYIQLFLEEDVPEPLCRYHCKKYFRAFPEPHFYYFGELFAADADWQPYRKQALNRLDNRYFSAAGELPASAALMVSEETSPAGSFVGIDSIRQSLTRLLNATDTDGFRKYMESLFHSIEQQKSAEYLHLAVMEVCSVFSIQSSSRKNCRPIPRNYAQSLIAEEYQLTEIQSLLESYGLDYMRSTDMVPSDIRLSQSIINYLMEHYQEPDLSVASLAEQFNLTVSYMGSVFKKVHHTSILQFLTTLRMTEAKNLLKTRQYKVSEVADMVGYTDVFYFSKRFKASSGYSPKEFMQLEQSGQAHLNSPSPHS